MPAPRIAIRIESPDLPSSSIWVSRLTGREAISQISSFDLEVVTTDHTELDLDAITGVEIDIVFEIEQLERRRIHGMITAADDLLDSESETRSYRLHVRPRLHRLALVETQDVFLDRTIPEIIEHKLSLVGLAGPDVELRLLGEYPKRDIVVEHGETDIAFLSRLTEHLGVSFFFEDHDGHDRIVFTDHPAGFHPIAREAPVVFRPRGEQQDVFRFEAHREVMPYTWVVQDYNYRIPQVDITASHDVESAYAGGVVEFGTHHKTPEEGMALAQIRAEERAARCGYFSGESDVCELAAGATFALEDHPRLGRAPKLLLVEVLHEMTQVMGMHGGEGSSRYTNRFRAVDAERTYRPPRRTPKPRMPGVVTGIVEPRADGSLGKVADLDEHGRYTVRLCFDTATLGERRRSSHRMRMIQHHVGPDYGTHFPLKAGIEVLVAFVNGDPDRPMIVGAVPNPSTPSPVTSRDPNMHRTKTASGILIQMRDQFRST